MSREENRATVRALLEGLSDLEVRELGIAGLRAWHRRYPERRQFSMHGDLAREVLPLIAQRRGAPIGAGRMGSEDEHVNALKEVFIDQGVLFEPWMEGVVEFVTWLVGAGLVWAHHIPNNTMFVHPITLHLTRRGLQLLDLDEDHPLLPGFADRVRARSPGLPDEVLSLLSDGRECIDHGLMRPSVVLMGVAFEVAIEHLVDALVARNALPADAANLRAAAKINRVRGELNSLLPGNANTDDRSAAGQALDFADALRRRRNDASHTQPTYGFEDRPEAEELLVSAGRHLPNLWRLTR